MIWEVVKVENGNKNRTMPYADDQKGITLTGNTFLVLPKFYPKTKTSINKTLQTKIFYILTHNVVQATTPFTCSK